MTNQIPVPNVERRLLTTNAYLAYLNGLGSDSDYGMLLMRIWISEATSMRMNPWAHCLIFADPDPSDPYVFGSPGSGFVCQRYGSGSGSFYHQAKIVSKTLIPTVL